MFGFINAIFLYALVLVIIPIIIHLFGIKKPVREVFAPLPLILKIKSRVIKKKRLHSLILILLRMMLFALVTIAFAGIFFKSTSKNVVINNKCLFILDNSPSVAARVGGKMILEYLALSMEDFLLKDEGVCRVNTIYSLSDGINFEIDREGLKNRDWLKQISIGKAHSQIIDGLEKVVSFNKENSYARVVLFSDMFSHFVKDISETKKFLRLHNIEVISPILPAVSNAFIDQVRFEKGEGYTFKAIVTVENGGDSPFYGNLQFYEGERLIATENINIASGTKGEVEFVFQLEGDISIEHLFALKIEGDDFDYDNNEYIYFKQSKQGSVLLVNGKPASDESNSEIFYLKNAIVSYFGENLQLFTVLEDMLPDTPQLYDIIVLCNVNSIDDFKATLLSKYVRDGGRLFITLGSRISIQNYNNLEFMPCKIKDLINLESGESLQLANNMFFDSSIGFSQSLKRVRVWKMFDIIPYSESIEILRTSNQKPLLIQKDYGRGSVILYATSIDMDMNDFPIRKNFVPFVSILFEKMLSGLSEKKVIYAKPEEEFSVGVAACEDSKVNIYGKKNIQQDMLCKAESDGLALLKIKAPDEMGFYNFLYGKTSVLLIVNADKEESILKRINQEEILELKKVSLNTDKSSPLSGLQSKNMSLVELLLIISAFVLIFEMFVMNK